MAFERPPTDERPWVFADGCRSILIRHRLMPVDPPRRMLDLDASLRLVLPETPRATCGVHHLRIVREGDPVSWEMRPYWVWDGDEDAPTLSPSIKCLASGWHGFLRRGRLEEV